MSTLTERLGEALAHVLAHGRHEKGRCHNCDAGRVALDEYVREGWEAHALAEERARELLDGDAMDREAADVGAAFSEAHGRLRGAS